MRTSSKIIFCASVLSLASCKQRTFNSSVDSTPPGTGGASVAANDAFDPSVVNKRSGCPAVKGRLETGTVPTRVFHWTNVKLALTSPKQFLSQEVKTVLDAIKEGGNPKLFLVGLSVTADPFQGLRYGDILVSFKINGGNFPSVAQVDSKEQKAANAKNYFEGGCPGFHFQSGEGTFIPFGAEKSNKFYFGSSGLGLWDLGLVAADSVTAWDINTEIRENIGIDPLSAKKLQEQAKNKAHSFRVEFEESAKVSNNPSPEQKQKLEMWNNIKEYWRGQWTMANWKFIN